MIPVGVEPTFPALAGVLPLDDRATGILPGLSSDFSFVRRLTLPSFLGISYLSTVDCAEDMGGTGLEPVNLLGVNQALSQLS